MASQLSQKRHFNSPPAQARKACPRVLLLVYGDFAFDGRARRLVRILKDLSDVTVLDVATGPVLTETDDCRRERVPLLPGSNTRARRRHLAFVLTARRLARELRPKLVLAANFYACLAGRLAASTVGARLLYDAYELITPEAVRPMSAGDYFRYGLERLGIGRADLVLAANACRAGIMQRHYRLAQTPLVFRNIPPLPECAAGLPGDPAADTGLTSGLASGLAAPSSREVRLLYQGDMNLGRGIGRFLDALPVLPANVHLVLAGGGRDEQRIRAMAARLGLAARVTCLGRIPNRQLPPITRQCHIGIVTYPYTGLNNIHCAPNKVFEYAQAGLPVITTDQPPLRAMVDTFGIGELVPREADRHALAKVILRLLENLPAYRRQLPLFLAANPWEEEAARVCRAIMPLLGERIAA